MVARAAEQATRRADAPGAAQASGTPASSTPNSFEQPLMADDKVTVFVLHRAMTVSAAVTTTKGTGRSNAEYRHQDAAVPFSVREGDEFEVRENAQKLKADVEARVEHLQMEAKIAARVVQLRRQQAGRVDG
jgi:hypothetical protein